MTMVAMTSSQRRLRSDLPLPIGCDRGGGECLGGFARTEMGSDFVRNNCLHW